MKKSDWFLASFSFQIVLNHASMNVAEPLGFEMKLQSFPFFFFANLLLFCAAASNADRLLDGRNISPLDRWNWPDLDDWFAYRSRQMLWICSLDFKSKAANSNCNHHIREDRPDCKQEGVSDASRTEKVLEAGHQTDALGRFIRIHSWVVTYIIRSYSCCLNRIWCVVTFRYHSTRVNIKASAITL